MYIVEFVKFVFFLFVELLWQFSGENKSHQVYRPSRSTAKKSWKKVGFFDFFNFYAACLHCGRGRRGPHPTFWEKVDLGTCRLYKVFIEWCWCTKAILCEFLCKHFLFSHWICMASGHSSDIVLQKIQSSDIIFQSGWTFPFELQAHILYLHIWALFMWTHYCTQWHSVVQNDLPRLQLCNL